MNMIKFYKIERWLYLHKLTILAKIIRGLIFLIYNSFVSYTCEIGEGTTFAYKGMGVVIHSRAKIGRECVIAQQVTVGGRSKQYEVPVIGDRVYVGCGAKILGNITIGNDVVIGAGAIVISSVPDGCAVAGVPARIIKEGITMEDLV